jgi:hypothetical protein
MSATWPSLVEPIGRVPSYIEPSWEVLTIRVLRPFRFRPTRRRNGFSVPLGPCRTLEIGETIEMIEPDALSEIALKRAELV